MENLGISKEVYEHLTKVIIPFWTGLRDDEFGGYYGYVDYELKVDKKAVKGCILNSRIMWFFSNAYMLFRDLEADGGAAEKLKVSREELLHYKELMRANAEHAYSFMKKYCIDREYGGMLWAVNYDGSIADDIKHTYNQAFSIYALSSYYSAFNEKEALDLAFEISNIIENRCTDEIGYLEAFNRDFTPAGNDKLSENGVEAEKTMNTLLHVFEAYTELYRVTGNEFIGNRIRFMMDTIAGKIYNPSLRRQEVFFDRFFNSIIDLHSYGHDIETSWLVDRGLEILKDDAYTEKMLPITDALAERIYERAYVDHSLLNECERGVDNTHRIWWVQAETVIGFAHAYDKFSKRIENNDLPGCSWPSENTRTAEEEKLRLKAENFRLAALDVWNFIKTKLTDHREGSEWFWELDAKGEPFSGRPIVEPWKCPYHNGRMCMELIRMELGLKMKKQNY